MKMREIAEAAGVSLTSVSLVLNGKPGIGGEKRALIAKLLQENGYHPRTPEKSDGLRSRSNICFLKYSKHSYLVNGNPGFVAQIMDAAGEEGRRHGYSLMVTAFGDFSVLNLQELAESPSTCGIILLGTEIDREDLAHFSDIRKPFVIVDTDMAGLPYSVVTMNNTDAVLRAAQYLYDLGHRKIGFLYNSLPSGNDRARRAAFEEVLQSLSVPFSENLVYRVFPTMDGARESFGAMLDRGVDLPTAFLADNDCIAIGAMRALQEHGLSVPEDISVIGFDGLPFSAVSDPPLTTVNVPCADIGRWAVEILHRQIRRRCSAPCRIHVSTELDIRKSTAPPKMATVEI